MFSIEDIVFKFTDLFFCNICNIKFPVKATEYFFKILGTVFFFFLGLEFSFDFIHSFHALLRFPHLLSLSFHFKSLKIFVIAL